jgi:rubrerythrin
MELYVEVDALSELSRQLGDIKVSLEQVSDNVDAYGGRLGSGTIDDALDDFVGGWRDGRKKIIGGIENLLGRIQGAIDTYREQEAKLSEATGVKK